MTLTKEDTSPDDDSAEDKTTAKSDTNTKTVKPLGLDKKLKIVTSTLTTSTKVYNAPSPEESAIKPAKRDSRIAVEDGCDVGKYYTQTKEVGRMAKW